MTKKNRIIALGLAIAVFFAMMLSVCIITHNTDHDCPGTDCQVCQQMESARQSLENLMSGMLATAAALALIYTFYQFVCFFAQHLLLGTLVALKVKLLN